MLHKWNWGTDITRIKAIDTLHGDEAATAVEASSSMLSLDNESATGMVVRSEPFRASREVHVSVQNLQAGQYVILPMSYDPCNIATNSLKKVELSNTQSSAEIYSGPQEESNFWLSVILA